MEADIERILIPREAIAARVKELAAEVARVYEPHIDEGLTLVALLSGAVIFLSDLIRHLPLRMKIALLTVSSYRGASLASLGAEIRHGLSSEVAGRHVLIVDDILDTGGSLRLVHQYLSQRGPKSIRTCVLLRKPGKAPPDVPADFVGFDIEDAFVVGYGLDFNDHYRNLPDIGILRPELYQA